MVSSTLVSSVFEVKRPTKLCVSLIYESKVEEAIVCTNVVEDIMHHV